MLLEIEQAITDKSRLELDLRWEVKKDNLKKQTEKERAERELQLAKKKKIAVKNRMDSERLAFLERCREFRASCKRTRVAASILVLEGENYDVKDTSDCKEEDLWRRLLNDCSDDEDGDDDDNNNTDDGKNNKKRKLSDPEMKKAEIEEKESRQALIEAECALHAERAKNASAIKRSNTCNQRLCQQRAALQRHRKEVEEIEREIKCSLDVVHENQLQQTMYEYDEKECHGKKQSCQASSSLNGSYSSNFNPPHETSRSTANNPYNQYRTPQTSSGYQQQQQQRSGGGVVTNPYSKQASNRNNNNNNDPYSSSTRANKNMRRQNEGGRMNTAPPYASDMLRGITPPEYEGAVQQRGDQHLHRSRNVRNQRQFGTSVNIGSSLGSSSGMTNELPECMAAFSKQSSSKTTTKDDDDISDVSLSSSESSDEEILSFNIFGKK